MHALLMSNTIPQSYAFVSLQMSSLRPGNSSHKQPQQRSSSYKKLSSLSSTPFPSISKRQQSKSTTQRHYHQYNSTDFMYNGYDGEDSSSEKKVEEDYTRRQSPFPDMPSQLFNTLAQSQFELLSNSLVHVTTTTTSTDDDDDDDDIKTGTPKISSMVLYLPKENQNTGQLEFVPAVSFPTPQSERVFIASSDSSNSGIHQPPSIPSMGVLGLPGFFSAQSLIPTYPFVSSTDDSEDDDDEMFATVSQDSPISVSVVEEIALPNANSAVADSSLTSLSVTLFSGLDTLGVLMIWPYKSSEQTKSSWKWTKQDKSQVSRAAKSLALALSMDNERASTQLANENFRVQMADSLHQVKSPLQALRTFGKLLQIQLAEENLSGDDGRPVMERVPMTARGQQQALKLAEDMISQGERVIGLLEPMDMLVEHGGSRYLLQGDTADQSANTRSNQADATAIFKLPPALPMSASPMFGEFEREIAYPQDVLGSLVYEYQAVSREKGINLVAVGFDPDNLDIPGVTISPKHLKEAVSNIIDNAIKYVRIRPKGKKGRPRTPQIKVTLVSNEPPMQVGATLYIEDNGQGIPKSERRRVFERGYRVNTTKDAVDGSGLGLAISREMITKMGGEIDIIDDGPSSKSSDGTTVRIILFREPEV